MSEDNIVQTEEVNPVNGEVLHSNTDTNDNDADEYMARFDAVENQNCLLKKLVNAIPQLPNQNARNAQIAQICQEQQKLNDQMFDLLVEMNNFFSPK